MSIFFDVTKCRIEENIEKTEIFGFGMAWIEGTPTGAVFSDCRVYRYTLWRRWGDGGLCSFVGLNPSTADESKNDNTVTRCITFARDWGFGGMVMLNLFGLRSTDPKGLKRVRDPVGLENDAALLAVAELSSQVVCCWGNHGEYRGRGFVVQRMLSRFPLWHLGLTKRGCPKHPLYLPRDAVIHDWRP